MIGRLRCLGYLYPADQQQWHPGQRPEARQHRARRHQKLPGHPARLLAALRCSGTIQRSIRRPFRQRGPSSVSMIPRPIRSATRCAPMRRGEEASGGHRARASGGDILIVWTEDSSASPTGDGDGSSIRARIFDRGHKHFGASFTVNTTTLNDQRDAAAAALPDGKFVIVWTDYSKTGTMTASRPAHAGLQRRWQQGRRGKPSSPARRSSTSALPISPC